MNLPNLPPAETIALFLDFDGTLVEIAEHPDAVKLDIATKTALAILASRLGNAVAIITGREIEVIDRMIAPLQLPVAGIHGLQRRNSSDDFPSARNTTADFVDILKARLAPLVEREAGLILEVKACSVALHYRARPELQQICLEACEDAIADLTDIELKRGKMVLEAKPDTANKGTAILDYMSEPPFLGRTPWFAGDDVTDEDAFDVVNRLGGVSIKVGPGETVATHSAESTAGFLNWLIEGADNLRLEGKV
ncbi:MAG: trehalose-phosphatase [Alphaproteobacteria bacterium]|nr:trehalose-phosphatase [Alphaproteobacteria bacterium]